MQQIGQGKCVITVISDKYLKSKNCMFELLKIAKNGSFYNRIFPIVLQDAKIYDAVERLQYIHYWDEKIDRLNQGIKEVKELTNLQGITDEINLYRNIRNEISKLTDTLQNMNTLTVEAHVKTDFNDIITAIEQQLNEDNITPIDAATENSNTLLKKVNIPERFLPKKIIVGLSILLMLGVLGLGFSRPIFSTWYMKLGWEKYQKGDLSGAKENYQRALFFNPNNTEVNFRLGLIYEDLQQFDLAEEQYLLAIEKGNQTAINNLARLYILNNKNDAAISLITNAQARFTQPNQPFKPDTEYALLKNLGWARFNQTAYDESRTHLDEAIALLPETSTETQKRADIYCLLAQVKEKQVENAEKDWNQCNAKANPLYPEEDRWRKQAQKRLVEIYQQQQQP
jgi:tetratricopeptide (TPR) repeat protein